MLVLSVTINSFIVAICNVPNYYGNISYRDHSCLTLPPLLELRYSLEEEAPSI